MSETSSLSQQYGGSTPTSPTCFDVAPPTFHNKKMVLVCPLGPSMRPRKNTWPLERVKSVAHGGLTGGARKKEQNRLASRRFRERRKIEMSVSEVQLAVLDRRNVKLRKICDDFSKKIAFMKGVLERLNCNVAAQAAVSPIGSASTTNNV